MKCTFIKTSGGLCKANAIKNTEFCFTHNPDFIKDKAIAVSKGGFNRRHYEAYGDEVKLQTPSDIKELLGKTINGLWTGMIPSNNPATAIGFLARAFLDAFEATTVEEKIVQLEERLNKAGI